MNGLMKLRLGVTLLFFMLTVALVLSFIIVGDSDKVFEDTYDELSYEEQQTLQNFYSKLPDDTAILSLIGWLDIGAIFGLFLLTIKLWITKKIWIEFEMN